MCNVSETMPPQKRKRGPYKKYLRDPNAEIPRSSRYLQQQQGRERNNIPLADEVQVILLVSVWFRHVNHAAGFFKEKFCFPVCVLRQLQMI